MTEKDNSLLSSVLNMAKKAMAEASKGDASKGDAKSDNPLDLLKTAKNLLEGDNAAGANSDKQDMQFISRRFRLYESLTHFCIIYRNV